MARAERSPSLAARVGPIAALVLLTVLAYLPAFRAGWVWDDDDYVTANSTLRSLAGLRDIWLRPLSIPQYYPLTHTTFWLEYQFFGLNPIAFHTTNVLLHVCSVVLLLIVLKRLRVPGAWLAAALFAVHPLGVESVAWATERKNVLSMVFYLSALLMWLRFYRLDSADVSPSLNGFAVAGNARRFAIGVLFFIAALLSKSVTSTLPAAMLVILWWKRGRIRWADAWPMLPMFVLSAGMGAVTGWIERTHVGAVGPDWAFTPVQRVLIAGGAIVFYARKVVWPYPLILVYPKWSIDPHTILPWLAPAGVFVALLALWLLRKRIGRGPIAAGLLFVGGLFPALGFVNIYPMRYSFVQDHFSYHASVAIFALAGAGGAMLARRLPESAASLLAAAVLAACVTLTYQQCTIYGNPLAYYAHTIAFNPAPLPRLNYAQTLMERHEQPEVAEKMFREVAAETPTRSQPWDFLGMLFESYGRLDDARDAYERERNIDSLDPRSWYRLGHIAMLQHDLPGAEKAFEKALQLDPWYLLAVVELGDNWLAQKKPDEAIPCYLHALKRSPDFAPALRGLAQAALIQRRIGDAEHFADRAVNVDPSDAVAWNVLGVARATHGNLQGASEAFQSLVALRPNSVEAHYDLSLALTAAGDAAGGQRELRIAQSLQAAQRPTATAPAR